MFTVTDLILSAALLFALISGWRMGTINVLSKVGSYILGYQAARLWSAPLAAALGREMPGLTLSGANSERLLSFLSLFIHTDKLVNRLLEIVLFIIIFIVVCWLVRRIAHMLTSVFGRGPLGKVNRALGALLALLLMAIFIVIAADVIAPALQGMGLGDAIADFFAKSQVIVPTLFRFAHFL